MRHRRRGCHVHWQVGLDGGDRRIVLMRCRITLCGSRNVYWIDTQIQIVLLPLSYYCLLYIYCNHLIIVLVYCLHIKSKQLWKVKKNGLPCKSGPGLGNSAMYLSFNLSIVFLRKSVSTKAWTQNLWVAVRDSTTELSWSTGEFQSIFRLYWTRLLFVLRMDIYCKSDRK